MALEALALLAKVTKLAYDLAKQAGENDDNAARLAPFFGNLGSLLSSIKLDNSDLMDDRLKNAIEVRFYINHCYSIRPQCTLFQACQFSPCATCFLCRF